MIPILMQDEKKVGFLKESLSCVEPEERNGALELLLTYPVTDALFPYAIKDKQLHTSEVPEYETEPALKIIYAPIMPVENKSGISGRILIRDFTSDFTKDETISNRTLAEKAEQWPKDNDTEGLQRGCRCRFFLLATAPKRS